MSNDKSIITERELALGKYFASIKDKIKTDYKYFGQKDLYVFDNDKEMLKYKTEHIHPARLKHPNRIPILFLFSNPHPQSVAKGLFLSEPHSQKFWLRLFQSKYFCLSKDMPIDLIKWNEKTPSSLGDLMLNGNYHSDFILYFHCLWPIPTNQVADLKKLFAPIWNEIKSDGLNDLKTLIKKQGIEHIMTFTGEVYSELTGNEPHKGRRDAVMQAVKVYLKEKNESKYLESLKYNHALSRFDNKVNVYLALDTRSKNMGRELEKRPFTSIIDKILGNIKSRCS